MVKAELSPQSKATDPKDYLWSFPGCPVKVRLSLSVVAELQRRFDKSAPSREEGLLVGGTANGFTMISGYRPLSNVGSRDRRDAVAALLESTGNQQVVGYYRFDGQDTLRLTESDISLAGTFFPKPHQVFLLIQPSNTGPANSAFFFW